MSKPSNPRPNYFFKGLATIGKVFFNSFKEIGISIRDRSIDWVICLSFVGLANVIFAMAWDMYLADYLGFGIFYVERPLLAVGAYLMVAFSGFFMWGLIRSYITQKIESHLRYGMVNAGLKSRSGQYPKLVSDGEIDKDTRKLVVTSVGISLEEFINKKEGLESSLQIYIDEVTERREYGLIEFKYAHKALPTFIETTKEPKNQPYEYPIGFTRSKRIVADFRKNPHLLIAGSTGRGKSVLLRNIISSVYLSHKQAEFYLIDLKFGVEFQIFQNLKRVKVFAEISPILSQLTYLNDEMQRRMETIRDKGCKDINEYNQLRKKSDENLKSMARQFIVVDEASDFQLSGEHDKSQEMMKAKLALSRIARMGRACGMHLILATQRPDAKSIDAQVKANLTSIVCFAVPNIATSMTILSNAKGATIPKDIEGRAIWKDGLFSTPVQTPYISSDRIKEWLQPFRVTPPPPSAGSKSSSSPKAIPTSPADASFSGAE